MDEYDEMCWQHEAVDHVLTAREEFLEDRATSTVPVAEIAGQRLAEPIVAETAQPTIDRATMDGYAFADDDDGPLEIVENAVFPETKPPALEAGQAIEIATGGTASRPGRYRRQARGRGRRRPPADARPRDRNVRLRARLERRGRRATLHGR